MAIDITYHTYRTRKVCRNYRIVHLSDYHSNSKINVYREVCRLNPDFIVFTGDLVDRRRYDLEAALKLIDDLKHVSTIFYVSGNHEAWCGHYDEVKKELCKRGVYVLEDNCYRYNGMNIVGISDFGFNLKEGTPTIMTEEKENVLRSKLAEGKLNILLAHRPEMFPEYSKYGYDLVFSGHAHGGQFRFFNQGIYSPNQGIFPEYTSGSYELNGTTLYVSRGLGNSRFPLRLFNNFEIVVVDLMEELEC